MPWTRHAFTAFKRAARAPLPVFDGELVPLDATQNVVVTVVVKDDAVQSEEAAQAGDVHAQGRASERRGQG